ncbi:DUF2157 domain-containing protein [Arenibacter sp. 6A1]|uniref:DUF2157 domain-containing protein n=1 Tax=Arenibacter sp. 6A1 TaxID=2720391 RepID=UPI0014473120|nr:DUF2157 domain-containing protein [Arenibacter sp. 6A1]NKI27609.1 DUF2157 domain-containing protein [Arenibacter sp. 6A1]
MTKIEREDIQIISRHSNLSEESIDRLLREEIYSDKKSWQKFLRVLFISLGIGFTTAGIIFFFAYNWTDLHKFIKIGVIEILILTTTLFILTSNFKRETKNILLTAASILVGVLLAVFGQVYQTGANAYDLFLGWTQSIALWVVVSNFAPLWLLFLALINITLIFYSQQVAYDWPGSFVITLLFIINVLFLAVSLFGKELIKGMKSPIWFTKVVALATVMYSTIGITHGIFVTKHTSFYTLLTLTSILYVMGIQYGLQQKSSFYLSLIFFSIIVIITAFLLEFSDGALMLLFISIFIIVGVTFVIKNLIDLHKKWID